VAGQWPFSVETSPALGSALVAAEGLGIGVDGLASFVPSLLAVTEEAVRRVLPLLPDPKTLLLFVEGDEEAVRPALERFGRVEAFPSADGNR
ncbi:MAG TPA: hypothetical protein VKF62_08490, partial [Planctomycetota bacterium]|nr:hypothetical protein [Planctomycetota bacterium]